MSYICRIACVALCSIGLLQVVFECVAWIVSITLTGSRRSQSERFTERLLFVLGATARLGPTLLVLALLLPVYIRGEKIKSAEYVGATCIIAATVVFVWFLCNGARLFLAMWDMQRCLGMCHEMSRSKDGLRILLYPGERTLLAVAGVFSSRIIISQGLLNPLRFSAAALDVAFAHESAHVHHHDNLKLLVLSMFPHLPIGTSARPSVDHQWRFFAELAADRESTQGMPEQSVMLAEMLVEMAKASQQPLPSLYFRLFSRKEDLQVRVERLLEPMFLMAEDALGSQWNLLDRLVTAGILLPSAALLGAIGYMCMHLGHQLAEMMLRFD